MLIAEIERRSYLIFVQKGEQWEAMHHAYTEEQANQLVEGMERAGFRAALTLIQPFVIYRTKLPATSPAQPPAETRS